MAFIFSSRIKRLSKELGWIGIGQFIAAVGSIVGVRLLTEVLPPAVYGELALAMTLTLLIQQTLLLPISNSSLRFFRPAIEAREFPAFLNSIIYMLKHSTFILFVVAFSCLSFLVMTGNYKWAFLVIASFSFAILSGCAAILDGIQNAARQRIIVAWHQGLSAWLRFLIAVSFIWLFGSTSNVAMWGYAFASVLVLASQYYFFHHKIFSLSSDQIASRKTDVSNWSKRMFNYAWPFGTWAIFTWAQFSSERWMLQFFATTSEVGLYAVLYQLGYYPTRLISGFLLQLLVPIIFEKAGDGTDLKRVEKTHKLIKLLLVYGLLVTFGGTLIAYWLKDLIFNLFVAKTYHSVSHLFPYMVLAGSFFAVGQFASLTLMSKNQTQLLMFPKILTALVGILLNYCGAKYFGLVGVVWASVIFSILYFLWMMFLGNHFQQKA